MVFGERSHLAFELAIIPEPNGPPTYGTLLVWAADKMIGYPELPVHLGGLIHDFKHWLKWSGKRRLGTPFVDIEEEWNKLHRAVYEVLDEETKSDWWYARTLVLTGEAFDGFVCFLLDCDDHELLLWRAAGDEIESASLALLTFDHRSRELIAHLESVTSKF